MINNIMSGVAGILLVCMLQLTFIKHELRLANEGKSVETVATVVGRVGSVNNNVSATGFLVNDGGVLRIAPYDPDSHAAISGNFMPTHILITKAPTGKVTSWLPMFTEAKK